MNIKLILRWLGALLASCAIGAGAGYVLMEVAPCSWFGVNFEGACAYQAMGYARLTAQLITVTCFALFLRFTRIGAPIAVNWRVIDSSPALTRIWFALLGVQILDPLLNYAGFGVPWFLDDVFFCGFVAVSALFASSRARHPAVALFAFAPFGGPLLVTAALFISIPKEA